MKTMIKPLSLLMAILMIATAIPFSAMANPADLNSQSLYESLLSSGELKEIDSDCTDSVIDCELTMDISDKIDDNEVLDELHIDSQDIVDFKKIESCCNSETIYQAVFDDGSTIDFDNEIEIISYVNFNRRGAKTTDTQEKDIVSTIKNEYAIDNSYVFSTQVDNGDTVYYWEKADSKNGCKNIYDSLIIRIDEESDKMVLFNRFDDAFETTNKRIIDEESAKSIALKTNQQFKSITSCALDYSKPNFFWNKDNKAYNEANIVRLVYNVIIDDNFIVQVDAQTGEVIGGDIIKATNHSGTFAYSGFNTTGTAYSTLSRDKAKNAFSGLGYTNTSTLVGDGGLRTRVLNFVTNDTSAYGFYIDCHGSTTTLETDSAVILRSSEVVGNWHLVFLDACSTAANTTWANAFHINSSYSKRAFLGWSNSVTVTDAYDFCKKFWPETTARNHSNNIRDAAVWAASQVPGSGTTPIRFYGDTNYNGRAY